MAGELGVGAEAGDGADLAEQLGSGETATAWELEQSRHDRCCQGVELTVELADRAGQGAAAAEQLAGDPHLGRLSAAAESAAETVEPDGPVERS